MSRNRNGSHVVTHAAVKALVFAIATIATLPAWCLCESAQLPTASCPAAPAPFSMQGPPSPYMPPGQPGASPVCGTCAGENPPVSCFSGEDCLSGPCVYTPTCPPSGPCYIPDPENMSYVDVRCVPARPSLGETDDTCRVKRAMATAAGRVLWISSEVVLAVSPNGEENGHCTAPADILPDTFPPVHLHGIPIPSYTTLAGGGTFKLSVVNSTPPNAQCDPTVPHPAVEGCQTGHMFKIKDAVGVTISGIRFDDSALQLACPNKGFYQGSCEHRHAVSIRGSSSDITIENSTFVNLVGDGVYIADTFEGGVRRTPERIVVKNSFFAAEPSRRNRNGISACAARDLRIEGNHFQEMGRAYFLDPSDPDCTAANHICPVPMPGAIDLEPDFAYQTIERVQILGNDIVGWAAPGNRACLNEAGIGVSNHVNATMRDVLIDHNHITGCEQTGILVGGSGTAGQPIVVTNNTVRTTRPHPDIAGRWGILAVGNIVGALHVPTYAHIAGNVIEGDGGAGSDGASMVGIFVSSAKTTVAGNAVRGARAQGLFFDERYSDQFRFVAQNVFCGNLLCDNGTQVHESSMTLWGSYHKVLSNRIMASPRGISVNQGSANEFAGNDFSDVAACGNSLFGCVFCEGPAGCQLVRTNSGAGTMTNCTPCSGGSGGPRKLYLGE